MRYPEKGDIYWTKKRATERKQESGKLLIVKQSLIPVQGIILLSLTLISFFSKVLGSLEEPWVV